MATNGIGKELRTRALALGVGLFLSFLVVPVATLLQPHFVQSLASQLRQLKVTIEAPGASTVRVYWDDPSTHPEAYAAFPVVEGGFQQAWNVELESLRETNPAALNNELWVFSIRTPEHSASWEDITLMGDWTLLVDESLRGTDHQVGRVFGDAPNSLSARLNGSRLTILVGRGPYQGKVKMTVNGLSQIVDLYSEHWRLDELTFFAKAPPDYGPQPHKLFIKRGRGHWNKLKFVTDTEASAEIQHVSVDGQQPSRVDRDTFELGKPRWPAYLLARIVTGTFCLIFLAMLWLGYRLYVTDEKTPARSARRTELLAAASFAGLLALVLTVLFYPGIFDPDAISRWQTTVAVVDTGAPLSSVHTWYPPLMTLIMMGTQITSGEFGLATFLQAFFFYYCLALLIIDVFGRKVAVAVAPLVAVVPTIVVHAVQLSLDTSMAIALMAAAILIHRRRERGSLRGEMGGLLLFLLTCVLLFGLRHNSIAVLPFLVAAIWILFRSSRVRLAYVAVAFMGAGFAHAIPTMIGARVLPVSASILVWEHVGILKELNDDEEIRRHQLDRIGDTARAIRIHQSVSPDNLIHGPEAPFPGWSVAVDHGDEVKAAFWRLVREHPWAFLVNRAHIYFWLLGIPEHLTRIYYFDRESLDLQHIAKAELFGSGFYGFYYLRDPGSLAVRIEELNATFVDLPIVSLLLRPWSLLTILMLLGGMVLYYRLAGVAVALAAGLAVAYYGTFFILSAGANFRYFFPSYVLLQIAVLACAVELAGFFLKDRLGKLWPARPGGEPMKVLREAK